MAPMMMIIKKSAVMIPVMLYRIIIATAVVGDLVNEESFVVFPYCDASMILDESLEDDLPSSARWMLA